MRNIFYTTLLCTIALSAHAATISVTPHEISTDGTSTITISIDTEGAVINALEMTLALPEQNVRINGIQEGMSFVSFWTGTPHIADNAVTLSGIIPGGFQGKGIITTLQVHGINEGTSNLSVTDVSVLLNDGKGTPVQTRVGDTSITISSDVNRVAPADDTVPPEPFTVSVVTDESIAAGKYVAIFAAQDKQTGIAKYEIQETKSFAPDDASWVSAISPYVLEDQTLSSKIFVRATDYAGNSRISQYETEKGISLLGGALYLVVSLVVVLMLFAFYVRHTHRKRVGFSHS